jgi:hypothetical protein
MSSPEFAAVHDPRLNPTESPFVSRLNGSFLPDVVYVIDDNCSALFSADGQAD